MIPLDSFGCYFVFMIQTQNQCEEVMGWKLKNGRRDDVSVMIVYENTVAGLRASEFLDRIAREVDDGVVCFRNFWQLNLLQSSLLQEQAALEASQADLIVLSLNAKTDLPDNVQEWLGRWLDHKENRPYTLAVVHATNAEDPASSGNINKQVRDAAAMGDANFFCWNAETKRGIPGNLLDVLQFRNPETGGLPPMGKERVTFAWNFRKHQT